VTAAAPVVELATGRLRGERGDGVSVFRAVPYARPPVGPLRFRPPEPAPPWAGVRDATADGPICPQLLTPLETLVGRPDLPQDEDCLTVNVWTPATHGGRRPVLVWIHGGAWLNGTGAESWFDGSSFARRHDVVVVTMNYRLNVFGWLHLGGLSDDEADSGNAGLLDQVAALRWVREHIGAFGGDPARVTVAGESAGAMSVGTLLATPTASGLFHRAILQSGVGANVTTPEAATAMTRLILDRAGVPADRAGVAALRALPAGRLLGAYTQLLMDDPMVHAPEELGFQLGPVAGVPSLPQPPVDAIRDRGAAAAVPVLVGTDAHEMEIMRLNGEAFYDLDDAEVDRRFHRLFGPAADDAIAIFQKAAQETGGNPWTAVDTDRLFRIPSIQLAEDRERHGARTWMYLFRWPSSALGGRLGAAHTVEIPFVFNTLATPAAHAVTGGDEVSAQPLADLVHRTWAQFVTAGDPNHDGLPAWPVYDSTRRATMILDTQSFVEDDPERERRLLWRSMAGGPST
jgi:para-nitrobenzyl esterase